MADCTETVEKNFPIGDEDAINKIVRLIAISKLHSTVKKLKKFAALPVFR